MQWRKHACWALFLTLFSGVGSYAPAGTNFSILINPGPGFAADPNGAAALAAFNRGADEWASKISSAFPVTINIDADFVNLGSTSIIGQTQFTDLANANQPYSTVRNAMAARSSRPGNAILASLPTQAQVTATIPASYVKNGIPVNFSFDSQHIGILTANRKVLGLRSGTDSSSDGIIQFNSGFSFEYNGVAQAGKMDFQTVAAHEIGHVLGFTSDVDDFDSAISGNSSLTDDLTTLDMFRFNIANQPPSAAMFTSLPRELRPGQESVTSDLSKTYRMATGAFNGDGSQASHWKDDFGVLSANIGIMDPTLSFGQIETVNAADLRAMELMGYDTVPEPSSVALVGIVALGLLNRRRASVN